jgi:hypothetical protein
MCYLDWLTVCGPHDDAMTAMLAELGAWAGKPPELFPNLALVLFVILCRRDDLSGKLLAIKPVGPPYDVLGKKLGRFTGTDVERFIGAVCPPGQCAEMYLGSTVAACLNRLCKPAKKRRRI